MVNAQSLRRLGADAARPERALADQLIEHVQSAADAVSRWAWVRAYERAERRYWPQGENQE